MTRLRAIPLLPFLLALGACGRDSSTRVAPESLQISAQAVSSSAFPETKLALPGGRALRVEVARTPAQRSRGLMFRTKLEKDYGMLFIFAAEQDLLFWMKNTFVDLDMIFIDASKKITTIARNVPKSRSDTPQHKVARRTGFGKYVLELPGGAAAGYGLKKGDRLEFNE